MRENGLKSGKRRFRLDIRKKFFKNGETLEQIAQGGHRCPIPGSV